MMGYDHD
jgi:hypothetical protein